MLKVGTRLDSRRWDAASQPCVYDPKRPHRRRVTGRSVEWRHADRRTVCEMAPGKPGFLISAFSYDPSDLIAGVAKPVFLIQGKRDLQVGEKDGRLLKKANPRANLVLLPEANHVLKSVASDDARANLATYADPGLPLAPGVVDAISKFLTRNAC